MEPSGGAGLAATTTDQDYYGILGVPRFTNTEGIRKAYLLGARLYHPDLHPDNPEAVSRMKAINLAYETLSDPASRAEYNAKPSVVRVNQSQAWQHAAGDPAPSHHRRPARRQPSLVEYATAALMRLIRFVTATLAV